MSVRQRDDRLPARVPTRTSAVGELAGARLVLHERAAADLHVEHEAVDPLGELLREDRRDDERDALDRRRDVAQRVDALVGGGDLRGLPDHARADLARRCRRSRSATSSVRKPGIASSLSSVPPVWPRPRPLTIGTGTPHAATSGARQRRHLVADAARRVLVDLDARARRERSSTLPGVEHRLRERHGLGVVEPAEEDRHEERGHLVVRDLPRHEDRRSRAQSPPRRARRPSRFAVMISDDGGFDHGARLHLTLSLATVKRAVTASSRPPRLRPRRRRDRRRPLGSARSCPASPRLVSAADANANATLTPTPTPSATAPSGDGGAPAARRVSLHCPLQAWMKTNMTPPMNANDWQGLADALERARAALAPPPAAGYTNWVSIAKDGANAARAAELNAVKAACRDATSSTRTNTAREMRTRPSRERRALLPQASARGPGQAPGTLHAAPSHRGHARGARSRTATAPRSKSSPA